MIETKNEKQTIIKNDIEIKEITNVTKNAEVDLHLQH